uniref:Diacylglycerol kinase n=1 Tax=Gadus morhua TaxID=8049 RepID=A0A8C5BJZ5_GADMO
ILCADNRKEMEEWMAALRSVQNREHMESTQYSMDHFSGMHNWYACSHARPTYCNVCREALSGVMSHGLSCEVCKFKVHKRCAVRATNNCKWTTLASVGTDIIEDEEGVSMPHQWLEGNLPVSAKCSVCEKTCGSVLRLHDWKCLWCKAMVHSSCKEQLSIKCPLGQCKVSVIPPTALNSIDSDGFWKASCPPSCTSPLLVCVNSKSGDNQGVKFLRRFKQLLNPAQVFDLMNGGPHLGLRLFQRFDTFRILVCGGDGSVGWVLSEIDTLSLHTQCQLGVLPLGTGNDLARVLGWGAACDDDAQLPQILEKLERASTKMLDRWSIMVYETKFPRQHSSSTITDDYSDTEILTYEDSVAAHLSKILTSDQHSVVISSAKPPVWSLSLLRLLPPPPTIAEEQEEEEEGVLHPPRPTPPTPACSPRCSSAPPAAIFKPREQLMLRANSLKKAIRQIIEHTERGETGYRAHGESCVFRDCYTEKCVMNNYFGIGLDAKISLDFNNKRDEHPEKCRSRTKNMMWYGVLGTKELLHRTYKNLEQRVLLECDSRPIPLPSLQGIAVLNIPSYAGGTNFWGGTKEDDTFSAPSFDDKILEVVAVFGSMQMAVSRVINLQHHRIAQCRQVKITILGDECVPVQVDGEAWLQPPGFIRIVHKNRTQTLTRDRAFESTLKSWEDKQRCEFRAPPPLSPPQPVTPPPPLSPPHPEVLSDEQLAHIMERWGTLEVGAWLERLCLQEYKEIFIRHDVQGAELLLLERRDLKDLGVTKVGHMKRILQGIRELTRSSTDV